MCFPGCTTRLIFYQIKVASSNSINYEAITSYSFDVIVTDDGTYRSSKSASVSVIVNVIDINEAPVFSSSVFTLSVDENYIGSITSGTITASDVDMAQVCGWDSSSVAHALTLTLPPPPIGFTTAHFHYCGRRVCFSFHCH